MAFSVESSLSFFNLDYGLYPVLLFVSVGAVEGAVFPYAVGLVPSILLGAGFFLVCYFLISSFVLLFTDGDL
jgi:hypothetical protein